MFQYLFAHVFRVYWRRLQANSDKIAAQINTLNEFVNMSSTDRPTDPDPDTY